MAPTTDDAGESLLRIIAEGIATGRYALDEAGPGQVLIGKRYTDWIDGDFVDCVALLPDVVSQISGLDNDQITRALSKELVPDDDGSPMRRVHFW